MGHSAPEERNHASPTPTSHSPAMRSDAPSPTPAPTARSGYRRRGSSEPPARSTEKPIMPPKIVAFAARIARPSLRTGTTSLPGESGCPRRIALAFEGAAFVATPASVTTSRNITTARTERSPFAKRSVRVSTARLPGAARESRSSSSSPSRDRVAASTGPAFLRASSSISASVTLTGSGPPPRVPSARSPRSRDVSARSSSSCARSAARSVSVAAAARRRPS